MDGRSQAFEVLSSYLSPVVHDTDDQGWEEVTDCSLTSMLRSALSKKEMTNNIVQLESVSVMPEDASRLQKVRQLSTIVSGASGRRTGDCFAATATLSLRQSTKSAGNVVTDLCCGRSCCVRSTLH